MFVFLLDKIFQPKYICICIRQKMATQIYSYSYSVLKIIFATPCTALSDIALHSAALNWNELVLLHLGTTG